MSDEIQRSEQVVPARKTVQLSTIGIGRRRLNVVVGKKSVKVTAGQLTGSIPTEEIPAVLGLLKAALNASNELNSQPTHEVEAALTGLGEPKP